jgi:hypothetical protein
VTLRPASANPLGSSIPASSSACCTRSKSARAQQNTAESAARLRYGRVTHPNHPNFGQILRLNWRIKGYRADGERRWICVLPDGTRSSIPVSWVTLVDGPTSSTQDSAPSPSPSSCIDLSGLLVLARTVDHLQLQEVDRGQSKSEFRSHSATDVGVPDSGTTVPSHSRPEHHVAQASDESSGSGGGA